MARERDWGSTNDLAQVRIELVVYRVRALGLRVALEKTEAMWFAGPRIRGPTRDQAQLRIEGVEVKIEAHMRYLGLVLDSRWNSVPHFEQIAPRVRAAAQNLSRLMPNLGGPGDRARRLYMGVVQSIVLYGAPVWHDRIAGNRRCIRIIEGVQRRLAIRVARGYRTISYVAACTAAGSIPWILSAVMYSNLYWEKVAGRREAPEDNSQPRQGVRRRLNAQRIRARHRAIEEWKRSLTQVRNTYTTEALRPVLSTWVNRRHGSLGYRLV